MAQYAISRSETDGVNVLPSARPVDLSCGNAWRKLGACIAFRSPHCSRHDRSGSGRYPGLRRGYYGGGTGEALSVGLGSKYSRN